MQLHFGFCFNKKEKMANFIDYVKIFCRSEKVALEVVIFEGRSLFQMADLTAATAVGALI
jgi:hypothetical protein